MTTQLEIWIRDYLFYLTDVRGRTKGGVYRAGLLLKRFINFIEGLEVVPATITAETIRDYALSVYAYRKKNGEPLRSSTAAGILITVKLFFRYLYRHNLIVINPARDLPIPEKGERLPRTIFSASEMEKILSGIDTTTRAGLRDRAILEFFYSTGVRKSELINLQLQDVDQERGVVHVRAGKGQKDRVVPSGARALEHVKIYIQKARYLLAKPENDVMNLFLSSAGRSLNYSHLGTLVGHYIKKANLGKIGNCHSFRHTCATLMIEGGADVRFVQAQLGHSRAETTQIYTRVSAAALKEMFRKYHPFYFADESEPTAMEETELGALALKYLEKYADSHANWTAARGRVFRFLEFAQAYETTTATALTAELLSSYKEHIITMDASEFYKQSILYSTRDFIKYLHTNVHTLLQFEYVGEKIESGNKTPTRAERQKLRIVKTPQNKTEIPENFAAMRTKYLNELCFKNYAARTVNRENDHLHYFFNYMAERGISQVRDVTFEHLEAYQGYLADYKRKDGGDLAPDQKRKRAKSVADFFQFLQSKNHILVNPAERMEFPKVPYRLPMNILSDEALKRLFALPALNPTGNAPLPVRHRAWRHRATVELFLATGIRCGELVNIEMGDINRHSMTLLVREGKGAKDRVVPLTPRAIYWIDLYIKNYRDKFRSVETTFLFVNEFGERLNDFCVSIAIKLFFKNARIRKGRGNSHLFRHTLATMLLEAGANLRQIQDLLGHKKLETTEIYTHVSIGKLKEVHTQTHPAEQLRSALPA